MRPVQLRSGTRLPCLLALSSLALLGCGGSDAPAASTEGASPARAPAATTPAATAAAKAENAREPDGPPGLQPRPTGDGQMMMVPPGEVVSAGDEEAVDAPMDPTFPGATESTAARPAVEGLPADDPVLGAPLVINGRLIPFDRVREAVCTGNVGAAHIESAKIGIFIQQEIDRRVAAGYDRKELAVGDEELSATLAELEEEIKQEFPGGEVGIDDVLASMGTDEPREQMRTMRLFKKLYLPENPDELPPLTIEALLAFPGGDTMLEEYRMSWEQRQLPEGGVRKRTFAERQFDEALIESIHGHLMSTAKVERSPAEGVLYRVNGRDITVDEIWRMIKPRITTAEVRKAKQWIVNWELLKAAFEEAGAWLSDEEAAAAYAAHSDPYKDSIFSQERIALVVKEFPSVDRYKDYRRLYESLHRMRSPIPQAELEKQAQFRTNKVVGQVSVDVDILLTAAFDQEQFRWKENGWVLAEGKMRDVINLLVEEQRPWDELMENYSDFYARPVPASQQGQIDTEAAKGRFRNYQRNNLLAELGESEYGLFLNGGESVTDFIFFEQEVGTLGDPMRGPLGWYMPRLLRRTKAPNKVNINPDSMNALILDDYLSWHVAQLARELIAKNEVYGLEMPGSRPELPPQPGEDDSDQK